MASITTWSRIEPAGTRPGSSSDDMVAEGLAARIADPLWLLARQWQVGEFQAEDGGTPIVARWRGAVTAPTRAHLGPLTPETRLVAPRFDADEVPLEALIERQALDLPASDRPGPAGLRLGVETGLHFLRILRSMATSSDYGPAFTAAFAVRELPEPDMASLDAASAAYLRLVAGRALDGRRLRAALQRPGIPDIGVPVAAGDTAEVRAAGAQWIAWVDELFSRPEAGTGTWQPERMEYACSIAFRTSPDPFEEWTLTAGRYGGGTLDWYSFDRNGDVNVGTTPAEVGEVVTQTSVPAPVTMRGMPAPRFWELEDALLDLGALQPGGTDLPQLLTIDIVSGYGNDWYVVGIDIPAGTLVRSRSLVVLDTFGTPTLLHPNGDPATISSSTAWSMFQLAMPVEAGTDGTPMTNAFYLAPSLAQPLEGPTLEEVLLLRDEQANLAWAVERRLENPLQEGIDAAGDVIDASTDDDTPRDVARYRLASDVPPHWIPLLPVRVDPDGAEIRLARGAVLDPDGTRRVITSTAALLGDPTQPLLLPEEEVPREGVVVRRSFQAARGPDGRLFVWLAHRASVGRGEGSSGLRFDALV